MGLSEKDVSRLLAGEVSADDPDLGRLSSFLDSMRTALPPVSPSDSADHHLAVITREARIVAASGRLPGRVPDRVGMRVRRGLAATGAALLVALTAGVGVAAALGVNPLHLVPGLPLGNPAPRAGEPSGGPTGGTGTGEDGTKGSDPRTTPSAVPSTGTPSPVEGRPTVEPTGPGATPSPSGNKGVGKGNGGGNGTGDEGAGNDDKATGGSGNKGNGKGNGGGNGTGDEGSGNAGTGKGDNPGKGRGPDDAAPIAETAAESG